MLRREIASIMFCLALSTCTKQPTPKIPTPTTPTSIATTQATLATPNAAPSKKSEKAMTLTKEKAAQQIAMAQQNGNGTPDFEEFTSIEPDAASLLSAFRGKYLLLDGLRSLDTSTATKLAAFKGKYLSLNGVTSLDASTATALAAFDGYELSLRGLKEVSDETMAALLSFTGNLDVFWQ